jgi:hypothetical protein
MRIRAEVIAVEDRGDVLLLTMQGREWNAPQWREIDKQSIHVPATDRNRRAFFVGRIVSIEARPL